MTWRSRKLWLGKNWNHRTLFLYHPSLPKMPKEKKEKKSKTLETGIEDVEMADVTASKVCPFRYRVAIPDAVINMTNPNRRKARKRKRKPLYP